MESLRASVPFTLHKAASAQPEFEGWASVFHTLIDAWTPTRILPGAFTKTIRENFQRIKILYQHNPDEPIGVPITLREDARGLYLRARLASTARGQEVAQLMRDGVLTELSIGFDPVKSSTVREVIDGTLVEVRQLSEVRLFEVSLVTWAANPDALVTAVHRRHASRPDLTASFAQLDRCANAMHASRDHQLRELTLKAVMAGVKVS